MHYTDPMHILHGSYQLMKHSNCLSLPDALGFDNILKKLTSLHELHDKEELFGCLDDLIEVDDVGVAD